jgi:hypothetical protein
MAMATAKDDIHYHRTRVCLRDGHILGGRKKRDRELVQKTRKYKTALISVLSDGISPHLNTQWPRSPQLTVRDEYRAAYTEVCSCYFRWSYQFLNTLRAPSRAEHPLNLESTTSDPSREWNTASIMEHMQKACRENGKEEQPVQESNAAPTQY